MLPTPAPERARAVAVTLVVLAAAGCALVGLPLPAYAAACAPGAGITVVVDSRELGAGTQVTCDSGAGGRTASEVFVDNGFALTYVQRQPGFVCRVVGLPTSDPCVNTPPQSAYWGLYWAPGDSGTWTYASLGADSLTIPAGASVAFAWQGAGTRGAPGLAPPATGSPTTSPSAGPTTGPTSGPTTGPTTGPTRGPTKSPSKSPSKSPGSLPTKSAPASQSPSSGPGPDVPDSSTPESDESDPLGPTAEESNLDEGSVPPQSPGATPDNPSETNSMPTETATPAADVEAGSATDTANPSDERRRIPAWASIGVLIVLLLAIGASAYAARRRRTAA